MSEGQSPWQFIEEEARERTPDVEHSASTSFIDIRPAALPVGPPAVTTEKADAGLAQAEAWERLALRLEAFRPQPSTEPGRVEAQEVEMDGPDTGLSGLRKLLLAPGLGGPNKARPLAALGAEKVRYLEETPTQRASAPAYTPLPRGPAGEQRSAAPLAQEPPASKVSFESEEADHAWVDGENARRDRREPVDAVQILPSWRGQYKKKK